MSKLAPFVELILVERMRPLLVRQINSYPEKRERKEGERKGEKERRKKDPCSVFNPPSLKLS
jgi:hypothetical protein